MKDNIDTYITEQSTAELQLARYNSWIDGQIGRHGFSLCWLLCQKIKGIQTDMSRHWLFESHTHWDLVGVFLRSESAFMINFSLMIALLSKCTFGALQTNEVFKMILVATKQMKAVFQFLNFCKISSALQSTQMLISDRT